MRGTSIHYLLRVLSLLAVSALSSTAFANAESSGVHRAQAVKITVLSTMLADDGIGEWGYAALVEVDGQRLLFDTGARPDTVLSNAREMQIDLANVQHLVLSHHHSDHTGGLIALRRELQKANPKALTIAHVGKGIFAPRVGRNGAEGNAMVRIKPEYEALGGRFIEHSQVDELLPGVWLTGPVPRVHPERNYPQGGKVKLDSGMVDDTIAEDASLVIATAEGLIVLTGCGHAGIINTVEYARKMLPSSALLAVIGGLHTFAASDETLAWTAERLKAAGLKYFLAGHCTGIEAAFRIRQLAGLDRSSAVVSAVGSSFTLGKGIDPGAIAR